MSFRKHQKKLQSPTIRERMTTLSYIINVQFIKNDLKHGKCLCYANEKELKCIYNTNSNTVTLTEGKTEENNDC